MGLTIEQKQEIFNTQDGKPYIEVVQASRDPIDVLLCRIINSVDVKNDFKYVLSQLNKAYDKYCELTKD